MKIRFRYNGLFILSCALFLLLTIQQTQIHNLRRDMENYAKVKDIKSRSQYVNFNVNEIAMHAMDAHALAEAAYDMAYDKMSRDQWMVGLTTEQVDSIRLNLKKKPLTIAMNINDE
jgi:hypothetical protein